MGEALVGIAGYTKAMEHFKLNKAISEYSSLIYGLLEHLTDLKNVSKNGTAGRQYGLTDIVEAANLVPKTWIRDSNADFHDPKRKLYPSFFCRRACGYRYVFR